MNSSDFDRLTKRYQRGHLIQLPRANAESWEWQLQARCRGLPVEQFYPGHGALPTDRKRIERIAKQICSDCPVLRRCRAHALKCREPFGVWGGLTATERAMATERMG